MIAGALSGVCEALAYAQAKGLDLQTVLHSVSTGAAGAVSWICSDRRFWKEITARLLLKHFIKDMKLALIESI